MSAQAASAPARSTAAPIAPPLLLGALIVILVLLCIASLSVVALRLTLLCDCCGGCAAITLATLVLIELRLPRTLLAVLVGASLGWAGAALQGCCAILSPSLPSSSCRRARRSAR